MVQNQYQQGANTLGLQQTQGLQALGTQKTAAEANQAKNLRDLSANIKSAMMAGNVFLGSMGAGDSSAGNQYAYALTKVGNRGRSDIMNQTSTILNDIGSRETNLNNIYNTEVNNLGLERDSKLQEVAQWYYDAANQIKSLQAQGQLGKSQDLADLSRSLLDQSIAQLNQINDYYLQKQSALDSWAMSNSQNIAQLQQNLAGISNTAYKFPQYSPIQGGPTIDSTGNLRFPFGYGSVDEQKGLFG